MCSVRVSKAVGNKPRGAAEKMLRWVNSGGWCTEGMVCAEGAGGPPQRLVNPGAASPRDCAWLGPDG